MNEKKALIVGATGLVGKELVKLLLEKDSYEEIIVLSRRPLDIEGERLKTVLIENFDNLADYKDQMNAHDIYCTIGTTRKKAGSKENFLKIDLEYPIELAKLTMNQPNFTQFLMVTSLGANAESPLFYNETKGKVEEALIALNMKSLSIFQPSLLLGKRDEIRFLEILGKVLSAILTFFCRRKQKKTLGNKRRRSRRSDVYGFKKTTIRISEIQAE